MSAVEQALAAAAARLEKLKRRQEAAAQAAALEAAGNHSEDSARSVAGSVQREDPEELEREVREAEAEVERWKVKIQSGFDAEGRWKMNLSLVPDKD